MSELKDARAALKAKVQVELRQRKARESFLDFVTYTKPDYEVNWHHRVTAQVADDFVRKKKRFVMIFQPPRTGKSEQVSRRLPAFIHGIDPMAEVMFGTYNSELASDMTVAVQRIMDTQEFQTLFPKSRITPVGTSSKYKRTQLQHELMPYTDELGKMVQLKGSFKAQGVGGSFTGRGANYIVLDDLYKNRQDADSPAFRNTVVEWYTSTIRSRLEKNGSILITLTRWHEDDLVRHLLDTARIDPNADQWEVYSFPAIKEDDDNELDPRKIGESLWPNKYSVQDYMAIKAASSRDWSALYQQRPSPESGNIVNRAWWKTYTIQPDECDQIIQSWDLTFKDSAASDFVVGQVWARKGANRYLLDQIRGRLSFTQTVQTMLALSHKWPEANSIYVEEAANGAALIDTLRNKLTGLIPVRPRGTKVARANAVTPQIEAGNVWLPAPELAPWVHDYIEEWAQFPFGKHDDQVDASSQALGKLNDGLSYDWSPVSLTQESKWL